MSDFSLAIFHHSFDFIHDVAVNHIFMENNLVFAHYFNILNKTSSSFLYAL